MNLLEIYNTWLEPVMATVGAASMVAAATPTKKDDKIMGKVKAVLNIFAMNFGGAKNAK